jgi:hypothetical protein
MLLKTSSLWVLPVVCVALLTARPAPAADSAATPAEHRNFAVAVYLPVTIVRRLGDPAVREREWEILSRQVKIDKVYVETERDRVVADESVIEDVKAFFRGHGVQVAGGITYSDGGGGQFRSFCYTDPADRAYVRQISEMTARHFDEVILDDFFFVTTKNDSDIAAKGSRSWTQFRLDLMNDVARTLIVGPAKAINPKLKFVIKYPNWYEHFQGLGFDLAVGPKIFDGIYTGTETRDPQITDQFLQQYESYEIMRYFENIAPGRNGGGWVDTYSMRYIDRYAEQLWDTMFAKAREITLFNWDALLHPINAGERDAWASLPTSYNHAAVLQAYRAAAPANAPEPTMAWVASQALAQVDGFLGKLGNPIGIKSYKPHHSTGEDFLHNYLGMVGVPIELEAEFPDNDASAVLLTESASFDPDLVAKIKARLVAGKNVVITSGLLRALRGHGIEDIVEAECTDRRIIADSYTGGFGAGNRAAMTPTEKATPILFPQVHFLTNDAWSLVSAMSDGVGFPLLLMDRYGKGVLYVWTMPDNFHHLYQLPPEVLTAIKDAVMPGFFVRLDGPGEVALYAYDNRTFIVESYRDEAVDVRVRVSGAAAHLRNLATNERLNPEASAPEAKRPFRRSTDDDRTSFALHLLPHSYAAFAAEAE